MLFPRDSLVLAIEMPHDVPDPVGILGTMRRLAGNDGAVLVVDERVAEAFTVPASEMERFFLPDSARSIASLSACRTTAQAPGP
jgi:hypothetical protein